MSNSTPVEVEITSLSGSITKATVRPAHKVTSSYLSNGKAYVTLSDPALFAVDINDQMEGQDTGRLPGGGHYSDSGPPIHTLSIFANPMIENRPDSNGAGVYKVVPGSTPPSTGSWSTLYFLPGVHDVGLAFPLNAGKNYYIPGDAIVYGTLKNDTWGNGDNIRVFGCGTVSGARLPHPDHATPPETNNPGLYNIVGIKGARNSTVDGITCADSPYHTIMLVNGYVEDEPTTIKWTKIFTWRGNGDGINPFANGLIEDCFIRTQDDSTYVNGRGIRRTTIWNDHNGSAFVLSALPNSNLIIEDCDYIYSRAGWHQWAGGRFINMRGEGGGAAGSNVIFRNIRVSDPRPTLQHFFILMEGISPYRALIQTNDGKVITNIRGPGDLAGLRFENIDIAAPSVLGEPDILWGSPNARISNVCFDNVTIGGVPILSINHFSNNAYVHDLCFSGTPPPPPVASVSHNSLMTNTPFTLTLSVDKDYGYWSTNSGADWNQFSTAGADLLLTVDTTVLYYGSDGFSTGTTNSRVYTFDYQAPVVSIISGPPGSITTNSGFTITLNSSEDFGYWSTNGSIFNQFSGNDTINIGTHVPGLWYFGRDTLGNTSTTNVSVYTFDSTAPILSIVIGPAGNITTNSGFSVSLLSSEDFGYWSTNGSVFNQFSGTANINIALNTPGLWYFGRDSSSNTSVTNSYLYTFDLSPPMVSIISGPVSNTMMTNAFTAGLSVSESSGYWSTNSLDYYQFDTVTNILIQVNTPGLWFYGRDALGNTSLTNGYLVTWPPPDKLPDGRLKLRPAIVKQGVFTTIIEGIPAGSKKVQILNLNGEILISLPVTETYTADDGLDYGVIRGYQVVDRHNYWLLNGTYIIRAGLEYAFFVVNWQAE